MLKSVRVWFSALRLIRRARLIWVDSSVWHHPGGKGVGERYRAGHQPSQRTASTSVAARPSGRQLIKLSRPTSAARRYGKLLRHITTWTTRTRAANYLLIADDDSDPRHGCLPCSFTEHHRAAGTYAMH